MNEPNRPPEPPTSAADEPRTLHDKIIHALRQVYDPEIPVNIYDLGLIYKLDLDEPARHVDIKMTLTTPNCPEAESLPVKIRDQVQSIPEIHQAEIKLVWDPPWNPSLMSEEAKLLLGME